MKNFISYLILVSFFAQSAFGASYVTGDTLRSPDRTKTWSFPSATDTLVGRASTDTLTNKTLTSPLLNGATFDAGIFDGQASTPANPAAGYYKLYFKDTNGKPYYLDSTGTETLVGSGSGGGSLGVNQLVNPDFETDTTTWTSSGGTFARTTTAGQVGYGTGSGSWDSSAASQTLTSTATTIPAAYYGQNGEAYCRIKTASGTATHTLQAYDGTNIITSRTITSSTSRFDKTSINFTFPTSGSISLRLVSVNSNEPAIYLDDCYLGLATNLGNVSNVTAWQSYTPTWSSDATAPSLGNGSIVGFWRRIGDSMEVYIGMATGGTSTFGTGNYTWSIPSGYTIDSSKLSVISIQSLGSASITAGSFYAGSVHYRNTTQVYAMGGPAAGGYVNASNPGTWNSSSQIGLHFTVPITGWNAEVALRTDQIGWIADANISGANVNVTGSNSSYAEITDASLTLTQNSGSIAVEIPCASGTASTGTTCSGVNESVGIAFTVPSAGTVEVCADFATSVSDNGSGTNIDYIEAWQLVETSNTSSTIVQQGKTRASRRVATNSASGAEVVVIGSPWHVCGTFNFASAGKKTVRLMYENFVGGTVSNTSVIGDADSSYGQRDIHFVAKPITQSIPAPLLVGSVTSNSTGQERVERGFISSTCSASPCTISSQSGTWLSSVTRSSAGVYVFNFTTGIFSAAPVCMATSGQWFNLVGAPSTSSVTVTTTAYSSTPTDAANIGIICMGPR